MLHGFSVEKHKEEYPSQHVLANALGKTQGWVAQHLRMLALEDDEIITRVIKWPEILSRITEFQAREILSAPPEKRIEAAQMIAEKY